jgi:copper resistance protein D
VPIGYWISVVLHVLAALAWLGGLFFFALVGAPVLRKVSPPELRQSLFHQLGMRARTVGWIAIAILLVTGTINLWYRGFLAWDGVLGSAAFWQTGFGLALGVKLAAVAGMLVTSAIHDFHVGPAAGRAPAEQAQALMLRRRASLLARGTALLGLLVVIAAVHLARG